MQTFLYDPCDHELIINNHWSINSLGYVRCSVPIDGNRFLHRIIMKAPSGVEVDHINRDPMDNRRANLRLSSRQEQGFNRGKFSNNTTGYTGVSFHCGKYQSSIRVNGRLEYLGRYDTAELAYEAYLRKRLEVIGW